MNIEALDLSPNEAKAKVLHLQSKLHKWASPDKQQRFCDLWNLVCDPATLLVAWLRVRDNQGSRSAGVDGKNRYYVERQVGVARFLEEIRISLKAGTYRPFPVREKAIPKKGGKTRPLGINTIRDRVVQMALKLVLEPILDADMYVSSYGYRPGRRAQDAIAEIVLFGNHPSSYEWVIEADIEACFDLLDRGKILSEVNRRIGDRRVLRMIKAFLNAGVMTETGRLERRMTGTPQGGILSPMLMNVALGVLDREFERRWAEMSLNPSHRYRMQRKGFVTCRLVRYADDFVVLVKGTRAQAEAILAELPGLVGAIGLTLSPAKTRLTTYDEGFEFLGMRIQRKPRENKRPCVYTFVSDEAFVSIKRKVKALTSTSTMNMSLAQLIRVLNPIIRGWAAYFRYGAASRTFSKLRRFVWWRVARWLYKKHRGRSWKWLRRRYRLHGQPGEAGSVLYDLNEMKILRYRFRGRRIPTPWENVETKFRQMTFDETDFLGRLQESLVG